MPFACGLFQPERLDAVALDQRECGGLGEDSAIDGSPHGRAVGWPGVNLEDAARAKLFIRYHAAVSTRFAIVDAGGTVSWISRRR